MSLVDVMTIFKWPMTRLLRTFRSSFKSTSSIESFVRPYLCNRISNGSSLDIGCGAHPRNPFNCASYSGIDIRNDIASPILHVADLSRSRIPFARDRFDVISAFDFLEHIPRVSYHEGIQRYSFIELINEVYRVLKPHGYFIYSIPVFPSPEAFQDPTHLNIMSENTMEYYFCEPRLLAGRLGYGFSGRFKFITQRWLTSFSIIGLLQST